jgi:hypothetical protein
MISQPPRPPFLWRFSAALGRTIPSAAMAQGGNYEKNTIRGRHSFVRGAFGQRGHGQDLRETGLAVLHQRHFVMRFHFNFKQRILLLVRHRKRMEL